MSFQKTNYNTLTDSLSLLDGEIHVWRIELNQECSSKKHFLETLSADEKQKADKFHFEKDRNHFIIARVTLRKILSSYLGIAPEEIRFSYNQYGKPFLDLENNQIRFNISHSEVMALFAITKGHEIGIDIEFVSENFEILKAAKFFFSESEFRVLKNLPLNLQKLAFFSGWTRKEALLKAIGKGFSYPPNKLNVLLFPEESNFSLQKVQFQNISLMSLPVENNYKAALAVEGKIQTICYWKSQNQ